MKTVCKTLFVFDGWNTKISLTLWKKPQIDNKSNTPTGASTNPKNFDLNKNLNLIRIEKIKI